MAEATVASFCEESEMLPTFGVRGNNFEEPGQTISGLEGQFDEPEAEISTSPISQSGKLRRGSSNRRRSRTWLRWPFARSSKSISSDIDEAAAEESQTNNFTHRTEEDVVLPSDASETGALAAGVMRHHMELDGRGESPSGISEQTEDASNSSNSDQHTNEADGESSSLLYEPSHSTKGAPPVEEPEGSLVSDKPETTKTIQEIQQTGTTEHNLRSEVFNQAEKPQPSNVIEKECTMYSQNQCDEKGTCKLETTSIGNENHPGNTSSDQMGSSASCTVGTKPKHASTSSDIIQPMFSDPIPKFVEEASQNEEDITCFICMGRFSEKRPQIPLPCLGSCNETPVHAKCIFEWKECNKSGVGSCPLCRNELGPIDYSPPDLIQASRFVQLDARRRFVVHPVHKGAGIVRCFLVMHHSSAFPFNQTYRLYLQAPCEFRYPLGPLPSQASPVPGDVLLLVARKRTKPLGKSVIDISLDPNGQSFSSKDVQHLGRVESSFSGLEHTIRGNLAADLPEGFAEGLSSDESSAPAGSSPTRSKRKRCTSELGAVIYAQNRIGRSVGPRRMQIALPGTDEQRDAVAGDEDGEEWVEEHEAEMQSRSPRWKTRGTGRRGKSESLLSLLKKSKANGSSDPENDIQFATNSKPYWLEQIQAYSLDFQGRATLPSNKNFQLAVGSDQSAGVTLQFGKVYEGRTKEVYTLDFQWPLSPLQAFGICLSACDRKLACA